MACVTCHRVIHSEKPCLTIDQLRELSGSAANYASEIKMYWCGRGDLNPHGHKAQQILSLVCLPFHHARTFALWLAAP